MLMLLTQGIKESNALYVVYVVYVNMVDTSYLSTVNAMYVNTFKTGDCGFYTTLYTVNSTLYTGPLTPPRGKATILYCLPSVSCSSV